MNPVKFFNRSHPCSPFHLKPRESLEHCYNLSILKRKKHGRRKSNPELFICVRCNERKYCLSLFTTHSHVRKQTLLTHSSKSGVVCSCLLTTMSGEFSSKTYDASTIASPLKEATIHLNAKIIDLAACCSLGTRRAFTSSRARRQFE
jgi:hypothetical protein